MKRAPPSSAPFWASSGAFLPGTLLFMVMVVLACLAPREPEVVIYGGTPQGVMAAVAASRQGLRVTLLEPGPQLGGVLVRGWLATLDDTNDLSHRSLYGGQYAAFFRAVGGNRSIDVGRAERVFWSMLRQAGVEVRLNTSLSAAPDAVTVHAGQVRAIRVVHRWGQVLTDSRALAAEQFIDASDSADLAARAGARFTLGREDGGLDRRQMAATLVLRIGGVRWTDIGRSVSNAYRKRHDLIGFDTQGAYGFGELGSSYLPSASYLKLRGLNIARQDDGTLLVNALLIAGVDGTDARSVTAGHAAAAREALRVVDHLRRADPSTFGDATLAGVAPDLYLRETRHLVGLTRLRADDVLLGRTGPEIIATGGYALDGQIYDARESPFLLGQPAPYGVPYGTLVPRGLENLLVVSQAASFDSAAAFSARVVPLQMVLGEAAGTACGLARRSHISLAGLARRPGALATLRGRLEAQGARIAPAQPSTPALHPLIGRDLTSFQALGLLRRGLLSAPYNLRGQLGSDQPMLVADFLSTLDHWLAARSSDPAQRSTLRRLQRHSAARPNQTLTWADGRAIFASLHEDDWEFQDKASGLKRSDAARLLTDMFPASDRQPPRLLNAQRAGCAACVQ